MYIAERTEGPQEKTQIQNAYIPVMLIGKRGSSSDRFFTAELDSLANDVTELKSFWQSSQQLSVCFRQQV